MASQRDKNQWQFSLRRMLGAVTLICITFALLGFLVSEDGQSFIGEMAGVFVVPAATMGLGAIIGVLVGGRRGATLGAMVGLIVSVPTYFLLAVWALSSM